MCLYVCVCLCVCVCWLFSLFGSYVMCVCVYEVEGCGRGGEVERGEVERGMRV